MAATCSPPQTPSTMADTSISVEGSRTVVWLRGAHDSSSLGALTRSLAGAVSSDDTDVIIDLSGITSLSGSTVTVLVRLRDFLRDESRRLTIRAPSPAARSDIDWHDLVGFIEAERKLNPCTGHPVGTPPDPEERDVRL